ncbi:MAG: cytochrome-c peroxidase [Burkholderiaceae bacterium]|jgi:cytochrome c peroxidase|nr:cytochrome-c peroxidase [Burkholderiaceae bacterium]
MSEFFRFRRFRPWLLAAGLLALLPALPVMAQQEPISPLPLDALVDHLGKTLDTRKVVLGEKLFHDKRLSGDNTITCASCHNLARNGADVPERPVSLGVGGAQGAVNAPTVFNARYNFRQFWDGRAANLAEQVSGPVRNLVEMGSSWPEVMTKLNRDSALAAQFQSIYSDGVQSKNIQDAIAAYEMTLTTPNAPFDKWLRGEKGALTAEELQGYQLFKSYGCIACHQGVNVGGNMYQTFGVMGDYFAARGNPTEADNGRFNVTRDPADMHVFKVPSLRNVALTPPYFHDGSAQTLEQAVDVMFRYQVGLRAKPQEKALIVKFLHTLTGQYRGKSLAR